MSALGPFRGLLLDLDGTLVDSRAATEGAWRDWAYRVGLGEQADEIAASCHGVPSVQHVAAWAPHLDATVESAEIEGAQVVSDEPTPAVPGAAELLRILPQARTAIVTSGIPPLAHRRLLAAGLRPPPTMVCAGDVPEGKPNPAPYLLAAARIGVPPQECVVVEDAPAGITAGRAAGAQVLVVEHDARPLLADLRSARVLPERDAALALVEAVDLAPPEELAREGVIDDLDVAPLYGVRDWRTVPEPMVTDGWAALGSLSDAAFAALAPAWMAWTLRHPDHPSYAAEALAQALGDRPPSAVTDAWLLAMADWL